MTQLFFIYLIYLLVYSLLFQAVMSYSLEPRVNSRAVSHLRVICSFLASAMCVVTVVFSYLHSRDNKDVGRFWQFSSSLTNHQFFASQFMWGVCISGVYLSFFCEADVVEIWEIFARKSCTWNNVALVNNTKITFIHSSPVIMNSHDYSCSLSLRIPREYPSVWSTVMLSPRTYSKYCISAYWTAEHSWMRERNSWAYHVVATASEWVLAGAFYVVLLTLVPGIVKEVELSSVWGKTRIGRLDWADYCYHTWEWW